MNSARILVVEDETRQSTPLKQMLEYQGYEVSCIEDGTKASGAVRDFAPLLVIVDLLLVSKNRSGAQLDGFEVTRRLRTEFPNLGILVWTAHYVTPRDEIRALRAGADDFVRKETDVGLIEARIEALLRRVNRVQALLAIQVAGEPNKPKKDGQ